MKNLFKVTSTPPIDWDSWNTAHCSTAPFIQSSQWANILTEIEKSEPLYVRIYSNGSLISQSLLMKRFYYDRFTNTKKFFLPYFECLHGPIFIQNASDLNIKYTLKSLSDLAQKNLSTHFLLIPNFQQECTEINKTSLEQFGFKVKPWATYLIDLTIDYDSIRAKFSPKVRNKLNKALRSGISIKKVESYSEFETVYCPELNKIKTLAGLYGDPASRSQWTENTSNGYHYYLAYKDEQILGCIGLLVFNGTATEIGSAISPEALERKYPAQDLLHWHIITEAKKLGAKSLDLAGVNPYPETPKEHGIQSFKKKWGGQYITYNIATKNFIPAKDFLAKHTKRLIALMS
ncbi:lipid II:glycine glycyltransferase FemX [Desulfovibrio gilichinskyi]|nr:peptidoglycan bridge formation glycyltransferase FemA/FemB family protein [Desulfovibrio gilichinskyi]